jgi:hypothetical protein
MTNSIEKKSLNNTYSLDNLGAMNLKTSARYDSLGGANVSSID